MEGLEAGMGEGEAALCAPAPNRHAPRRLHSPPLGCLPQTFWHSSAHVLGQALELEYGADLTIGPSLGE